MIDAIQHLLDAWWAATTFDESLIQFLKATPVADLMNRTRWAWPISESVHFVGLALLIGIVAPLDVRLMGFMKGVSIESLHRLVRWAVLGFVLNLITGLMFLTGTPEQYLGNVSWWFKMLFLLVAGANMLAFELTQRARAFDMAADAPTPWSMKAIGAVSLSSWLMVLYWGRMLPFVGGAF